MIIKIKIWRSCHWSEYKRISVRVKIEHITKKWYKAEPFPVTSGIQVFGKIFLKPICVLKKTLS